MTMVLVVFMAIALIGAAVYIFTTPKKAAPKKAVAKKTKPTPTPVKTEQAKPQAKARAKKEVGLKGIPTKVSIPERKVVPIEREAAVKKEIAAPQHTAQYDYPSDLPGLSDIMYSTNYPQAIINGEMFSEGETIQGYKIKKILPDRVILTRGNKDYVLRLR